MDADDTVERVADAIRSVAYLPLAEKIRAEAVAQDLPKPSDVDIRMQWTRAQAEAAMAVKEQKPTPPPKGVEVRPDLSQVSLLIGTPSTENQYDGNYVRSFMNTAMAVRQYGGRIDWARVPYCADVALARARLFGTFYRSKHTHLLSVDSDMGWSFQDVVRMLMLGREFIAAAGPKKIPPPKPIEYAMSLRQDDGSIMPLDQDPETGLMKVARVGGAFVLIHRTVAAAMVASYPDTAFEMDGVTEWGVYDPLVVNQVRMSEDYSFCHRWLKTGGDIFVDPNIRLKHSGSHTWEGALMDTFYEAARDGGGLNVSG